MDAPYRYERFVCSAFELALQKRVNRWEDPAAFADTDTFTAGNLPVVKAAVIYAMGIYLNNIEEKPEELFRATDEVYKGVISAGDPAAIIAAIDKFDADVVDVFFEREDGMLKPR